MDPEPPSLVAQREEARADLMDLVVWAPAWAFALASVVHAIRARSPFGAEETLALAAAALIALHGACTVARHVRLQSKSSAARQAQGAYR